jgi:ketosteroid isomerase-like protein
MGTRADVEARAREFSKAVANQDAAEIASLYTKDCRFMPPNLPLIEGSAGVKDFSQQMFEMGVRSLDLEVAEVLEDGDLVVVRGRYVMGIQPPGGDPIQDVGKYVEVRRRQRDGSLKIFLDTFNSDLPAPPA